MKTFYVQVNELDIITDVIEYPYGNYIPIQLESLPAGIYGGWFKLENGKVVEYPELKPKQEDNIRQLVEEEIVKQMRPQATKIEAYENLDKNFVALDDLRTAKLEAMKETCDNNILAGFYSTTVNAMFGFTFTDQMNMTQQMIVFMIDPTPVTWKTEDKGTLQLTKEQFMQVAFEAGAHKEKQISRWWQIKNELLTANSKEEIIQIKW